MKINNYEDSDDYLDKLQEKELSKYKYKNRSKKMNESFALQDLLSLEQRKKILQYTENGR